MTDDVQIANLIADLDHPDKPTIRAAVDALISLATGSADFQQILQQRLTEPGHRNYWPAAYVLGHLPYPSGAVIQNLIEALDHREPDIRWAIALLLVRIAKTHGDLIKSLADLCTTGTVNQKRMALYCIRDLALSDSGTLTALLEGLRDADPTVRVAAAICLKLRPDLNDVGKTLLLEVYLKDTELRVRNTAAIALANLGSPAPEFLSALRKASESDSDQVRKAAIAALDLLEKRRSASSGSSRDR
jgi:HEAT repeat protein